MAFTPKTWANRAVEFAGRRLLTAVAGIANTFDITRAEGTVFVPGDEINATNLNDLETRIANEFTAISGNSPTTKTIVWASGNTPVTSFCYKIGNVVHIDFKLPASTQIGNSTETVGTVPLDCRPSINTNFVAVGHANRIAVATYNDSFGILAQVLTNGEIRLANDFGLEMWSGCISIEYLVV